MRNESVRGILFENYEKTKQRKLRFVINCRVKVGVYQKTVLKSCLWQQNDSESILMMFYKKNKKKYQ